MSKEKNLSLKNQSIPNQKKSMGNKKSYYYLLSIILLTAFVYSPTFENDFVDWDDDIYVVKNELLKEGDICKMYNLDVANALKASYNEDYRDSVDVTPFVAANYHPLTMHSMHLNYSNIDLSPFSFQLTNILLHLLNVILVFLLLKTLLPRQPIAILIGTALFALHPMHVESVSWISERKDVLYTVFFILGIIAYLRFKKRKQWPYYFITIILFLASCLSKPAAVVFPLIIVLIDYFQDWRIHLKNLLRYIPLFAISLFFGLITLTSQTVSGAMSKIDYMSQFDKIIMAGHSIQLYLVKFIFPIDLCALYPMPLSIDGKMYLSFLFTTILLFISFRYRKKYPKLSFGFFFFVINLILILQIVSVGAAMIAERYTYVPYIGLSIITGVLIERAYAKWKNKAFFLYAPIMFLVLLSFLTYNRTKIWKNTETLFTDVLIKEPNQQLGWSKRAYYLKKRGDSIVDGDEQYKMHSKALRDFNKAIKLDPNIKINRNERGDIYFKREAYDKALSDFTAGYELGDSSALILTNMATSMYKLNQKAAAIEFYNKAIKSDSTFGGPYYNRGIDYFSDKQYAKALLDFEKYIDFDSTNGGVFYTMASCLKRLERYDEAVLFYGKAIEYQPSELELAKYYFERGLSNYLIGNLQDSKSDIQNAQKKGFDIPDFLLKEFDL